MWIGKPFLMLSRIRQDWPGTEVTQYLFLGLAISILAGVLSAMFTNSYLPLGLPALVLLTYLVLVDFRVVYFLLIASLPLSTEFVVSGGLATDLPSEPLMVGLMLVFLTFSLGVRGPAPRFLWHPITLILLIHLLWIGVATIASSLMLVSVKYFLAKTWYIVVFYFMTGLLIRTETDFKRLFWCFFIPLMLTVLVILLRHAAFGFSFRDIYRVLHPFYRNHVAYAGIMALFLPLVFLALGWYRRYSGVWWLIAGAIPVLLVAIYLSYTRAAYVSVVLAVATYYVIRLRLIRLVLLVALAGSLLGVGYFVRENTYLEYAPNYDRTITHTEFNNLIEATYNLEDISTVERFYRWIAGFYMFSEKPVTGFGPGNFVNFYRSYTVTSFRTYVSRNEDQSGIHSYYLMLLTEQGLIGLAIFLWLSFYFLIRGERLYHRSRSAWKRRIIMMVLLCTIVINAFSIINDVVETDKFGPMFFICLAVLVNLDHAEE